MTTNNRIFDLNTCPKSSSRILMGNLIINNVTNGYSETFARVLYFIHNESLWNENDVFDDDFQIARLCAPTKSFFNLRRIDECSTCLQSFQLKQTVALPSRPYRHLGYIRYINFTSTVDN